MSTHWDSVTESELYTHSTLTVIVHYYPHRSINCPVRYSFSVDVNNQSLVLCVFTQGILRGKKGFFPEAYVEILKTSNTSEEEK